MNYKEEKTQALQAVRSPCLQAIKNLYYSKATVDSGLRLFSEQSVSAHELGYNLYPVSPGLKLLGNNTRYTPLCVDSKLFSRELYGLRAVVNTFKIKADIRVVTANLDVCPLDFKESAFCKGVF